MAESDKIRLEQARTALSPTQKKFLKAYGECGVIKYACKSAGIHRSTFYAWHAHDQDFQICLPHATDDANDTLEYAAFQQSVLGTEEPAISGGQVVYDYTPMLDDQGRPMFDDRGKPLMKRGKMVTVRKYSPQLLITLLKAKMPEKYKDKQQLEHTGRNGGPIEEKFTVHVFMPEDDEVKDDSSDVERG